VALVSKTNALGWPIFEVFNADLPFLAVCVILFGCPGFAMQVWAKFY